MALLARYLGFKSGFGLSRFRVSGGQDGFWVKNEKWFKWVKGVRDDGWDGFKWWMMVYKWFKWI